MVLFTDRHDLIHRFLAYDIVCNWTLVLAIISNPRVCKHLNFGTIYYVISICCQFVEDARQNQVARFLYPLCWFLCLYTSSIYCFRARNICCITWLYTSLGDNVQYHLLSDLYTRLASVSTTLNAIGTRCPFSSDFNYSTSLLFAIYLLLLPLAVLFPIVRNTQILIRTSRLPVLCFPTTLLHLPSGQPVFSLLLRNHWTFLLAGPTFFSYHATVGCTLLLAVHCLVLRPCSSCASVPIVLWKSNNEIKRENDECLSPEWFLANARELTAIGTSRPVLANLLSLICRVFC